MKICPCYREKAFSAQDILSADEMSPAGQAKPRKEQTQKVVANIFNMRHFTARRCYKVMIIVIIMNRLLKFFYIAYVNY